MLLSVTFVSLFIVSLILCTEQFANGLWYHCCLQSLDKSLVQKLLTFQTMISRNKGSSIPTAFLKDEPLANL